MRLSIDVESSHIAVLPISRRCRGDVDAATTLRPCRARCHEEQLGAILIWNFRVREMDLRESRARLQTFEKFRPRACPPDKLGVPSTVCASAVRTCDARGRERACAANEPPVR